MNTITLKKMASAFRNGLVCLSGRTPGRNNGLTAGHLFAVMLLLLLQNSASADSRNHTNKPVVSSGYIGPKRCRIYAQKMIASWKHPPTGILDTGVLRISEHIPPEILKICEATCPVNYCKYRPHKVPYKKSKHYNITSHTTNITNETLPDERAFKIEKNISAHLDSWKNRFKWETEEDVYKIVFMSYMCLLVIVMFCNTVYMMSGFRKRWFVCLSVKFGWLVSLGEEVLKIDRSGILHCLSCTRENYCDCHNSIWCKNFLAIFKQAYPWKVDAKGRPNIRIHGSVMKLGVVLLFFIHKVEAAPDMRSIEMAGSYTLMVAGFLALTALFVRRWYVLAASLCTACASLILSGTLTTEELVAKDIMIISGSIGAFLSLLLLGHALIVRIRKHVRSHNDDPERKLGKAKRPPHTDTVSVVNYRPKVMPRRFGSFYVVIFKLVLLLLLIGGIGTSPLHCKVQSNNFTQPPYDLVEPTAWSYKMDIQMLLDKMQDFEENVRTAVNFSIPVMTVIGGYTELCPGYYETENGRIFLRVYNQRILLSSFMKVGNNSILPGVCKDFDFRTYYYGAESCHKCANTKSWGSLLKHKDLSYWIFEQDSSLMLRYAPEINYKIGITRLGVWSYYSHTSEYCSTCVSLTQFKKWKKTIEDADASMIRTANAQQVEIDDAKSILHGVVRDLNVVSEREQAASESSHLAIAEIVGDVEHQLFSDILKARIESLKSEYTRMHTLVANIFIDAAGSGKPRLSKDTIDHGVQQVLKQYRYAGKYLPSTTRMSLNDGMIYISFLTADYGRPKYEYSRKSLAMCYMQDEEMTYYTTDLVLYDFAAFEGCQLTFKHKNVDDCESGSCLYSGLMNSPLLKIIPSNVSNWISLYGDVRTHIREFTTIKNGVIMIDGIFILIVDKSCQLYSDESFSNYVEYKHGVHILTKEGDMASVTCDGMGGIATVKRPTQAYFNLTGWVVDGVLPVTPPEDATVKDPSKYLPVTVDHFEKKFNEWDNSSRDAHASINMSHTLLEYARDMNFTVLDKYPNWVKVIDHIAQGALKDTLGLVNGIAALPGKILGSTFLTLIPYVLSGCAIAIAVAWPPIYHKYAMRGFAATVIAEMQQNKYQTSASAVTGNSLHKTYDWIDFTISTLFGVVSLVALLEIVSLYCRWRKRNGKRDVIYYNKVGRTTSLAFLPLLALICLSVTDAAGDAENISKIGTESKFSMSQELEVDELSSSGAAFAIAFMIQMIRMQLDPTTTVDKARVRGLAAKSLRHVKDRLSARLGQIKVAFQQGMSDASKYLQSTTKKAWTGMKYGYLVSARIFSKPFPWTVPFFKDHLDRLQNTLDYEFGTTSEETSARNEGLGIASLEQKLESDKATAIAKLTRTFLSGWHAGQEAKERLNDLKGPFNSEIMQLKELSQDEKEAIRSTEKEILEEARGVAFSHDQDQNASDDEDVDEAFRKYQESKNRAYQTVTATIHKIAPALMQSEDKSKQDVLKGVTNG